MIIITKTDITTVNIKYIRQNDYAFPFRYVKTLKNNEN